MSNVVILEEARTSRRPFSTAGRPLTYRTEQEAVRALRAALKMMAEASRTLDVHYPPSSVQDWAAFIADASAYQIASLRGAQ